MRDKVVVHIWTCLTIVFVSIYVCQLIWNSVVVYKTSGGTTLSLEGGSLPQVIMVCSVYYLSKFLLKDDA